MLDKVLAAIDDAGAALSIRELATVLSVDLEDLEPELRSGLVRQLLVAEPRRGRGGPVYALAPAAPRERHARLTAVLEAVGGHPLRLEILWASGVLASAYNDPFDHLSAAEIHRLLGEPKTPALGVLAYHFRWLAEHELIVLANTIPRRGALEHRYRLTPVGLDHARTLVELRYDLR